MNYAGKWIRVSSRLKAVQATQNQIRHSAFMKKIRSPRKSDPTADRNRTVPVSCSVPETLLLAEDAHPLPEPASSAQCPSGPLGWCHGMSSVAQQEGGAVGSCNCTRVHTPCVLCSHGWRQGIILLTFQNRHLMMTPGRKWCSTLTYVASLCITHAVMLSPWNLAWLCGS